jgi:DNA polymerase III subunit gamma/tau
MAKALYRKWRPQDWDEVAAQEHVIQTLKNAVALDRVGHAYLFSGPRGTGKTTTARLLAKAVNCQNPDRENRPCNQCEHCLALNAGRFMDLIEIDAASNTSVDDVRDLREKINFSPSRGDFKVYIIDEVHMLSTAAFNALLKTLEEPPPHAIFVLATTEIQKIPATVLSRCQRHEFRPIPVKIIVEHLKHKSKSENIQVEDAVYSEIARQATGSLRDAISLLDQLTSTTETINLEMAQKVLGTATNESVIDIIDALIKSDSAVGLTKINQALDSGTDPRQLARQLVTYLRNILLYKMDNKDQIKVSETVRKEIHEHASQIPLNELLRAIEAFNNATVDKHANWHPGLGLELAFTNYLVQPEKTPQAAAQSESVQSRAKDQQTIRQREAGEPAPPQTTKTPEGKPDQHNTQKPSSTPSSQSKQSKSKVKVEESHPGEDIPPIPEETSNDIEVAESSEISLNEVHRLWPKIKSMVGQHNRRTEGLLNSARIAGLQENTLLLGFTSDTLKNMMERERNINITGDILEEVFRHPVQVKCIVTTSQSSSIPTNLEIDKDGMVGTATRDLGGKISKVEEVE